MHQPDLYSSVIGGLFFNQHFGELCVDQRDKGRVVLSGEYLTSLGDLGEGDFVGRPYGRRRGRGGVS